MKRRFPAAAVALAVLAWGAIPNQAAAVGSSLCDAIAGNLVTNCGFETGSLSGWSLTGNTGFTGVAGGGTPHTGSFGVFEGPVGSDGFLNQTLPTVAGT